MPGLPGILTCMARGVWQILDLFIFLSIHRFVLKYPSIFLAVSRKLKEKGVLNMYALPVSRSALYYVKVVQASLVPPIDRSIGGWTDGWMDPAPLLPDCSWTPNFTQFDMGKQLNAAASSRFVTNSNLLRSRRGSPDKMLQRCQHFNHSKLSWDSHDKKGFISSYLNGSRV